jgi:hypothetical protein
VDSPAVAFYAFASVLYISRFVAALVWSQALALGVDLVASRGRFDVGD